MLLVVLLQIHGLLKTTQRRHSGANAGSENQKNQIAEIDIKVDSIAVTAQTKKLKAKWSPIGSGPQCYHNLDAEVELTGILSTDCS